MIETICGLHRGGQQKEVIFDLQNLLGEILHVPVNFIRRDYFAAPQGDQFAFLNGLDGQKHRNSLFRHLGDFRAWVKDMKNIVQSFFSLFSHTCQAYEQRLDDVHDSGIENTEFVYRKS